MNRFALKQNSTSYRPPIPLHRQGFDVFIETGREPMRRYNLVVRAFLTSDRRHVRLTKSGGRFDERIEHGFEIEGRAADDLEHVSGGGLLLQGLAKFIEQAGILDGDDGLGGEIPDQIYLLIVEGSDL